MGITVSIQSYELATEGVQAAVLADIVDLGVQPTKFGPKEKIQFVWFLEEVDSQGYQKRIFQRFTKSLNEKATLRKTLIQLGVKFDEKTKDVDVESVLGTQASLVINISEDGKFANVLSIMKPRAGQAVPIPDTFTRKQDRDTA